MANLNNKQSDSYYDFHARVFTLLWPLLCILKKYIWLILFVMMAFTLLTFMSSRPQTPAEPQYIIRSHALIFPSNEEASGVYIKALKASISVYIREIIIPRVVANKNYNVTFETSDLNFVFSLKSLAREEKTADYRKLHREIFDLTQSYFPAHTMKYGEVQPEQSSKRHTNQLIYITIGNIIGLFFGCVLAFLIESLRIFHRIYRNSRPPKL